MDWLRVLPGSAVVPRLAKPQLPLLVQVPAPALRTLPIARTRCPSPVTHSACLIHCLFKLTASTRPDLARVRVLPDRFLFPSPSLAQLRRSTQSAAMSIVSFSKQLRRRLR